MFVAVSYYFADSSYMYIYMHVQELFHSSNNLIFLSSLQDLEFIQLWLNASAQYIFFSELHKLDIGPSNFNAAYCC